jgi:hypothetical protein
VVFLNLTATDVMMIKSKKVISDWMNFRETSPKGEDSELWFEVMDRINSGEMPPEEESQPTEKEIEQVVNWLGLN